MVDSPSPSALVVSSNSLLAYTRERILEAEGFEVTSVMTSNFNEDDFRERNFTVLVFGHSVAGPDKTRIAKIVHCGCIIELFTNTPTISEAKHCEALDPWKLATTLRELAAGK